MYAMTYYLRELKMNCNYFIGKLFILKLFFPAVSITFPKSEKLSVVRDSAVKTVVFINALSSLIH